MAPAGEPNQLPDWTAAERSAWRRPRQQTVSEWADENRVLDPAFSARGGRWSSSTTPYSREWMDSACCRWVRRVTIMASTQASKTETTNNVVGYHVHQRPCPIMFVLPRRDDAELAQQKRVLPMVRASAALRGELTGAAHDVKHREMTFRRCTVYFRAAQSPADLAAVPVRLVIGDECEKWPRWTGREAGPLDLVIERTRTFFDHLVYLTSTPGARDGLIHREFQEGDQRRYWVPCARCSKMILLRWEQVRWPKDVDTAKQMRRLKRAWYECQECGGELNDKDKLSMLAGGLWVPDGQEPEAWRNGGAVADRADHRSYHLWAGYSPWLSWWKIAAQWLYSRDHPDRLQNFVNSWLADVWEDTVEDTSPGVAAACVEPGRRMGEVPADVLVVTAAVDVQKAYLQWAVWGWGLDEESWLLAAGTCGSWQEVDAAVFRAWGPKNLPLRICLVDSRHRRAEVIDFVRRKRPVARMIAGVERETPVPFGTLRIDKHPRTGASLPNSMLIWTVHVALFKDLVASRLALSVGDDAAAAADSAGRVHLPADLPDEMLRQLSSEHKVRVRSRGRERMRWVIKATHRRNELWDLAVYCAAAARLVRCDLLRRPRPLDGGGEGQPPGPSNPPAPKRTPGSRGQRPSGRGLYSGIGGGR